MEVLEHTLKCPVCLDLFTNPVLLPCGHNFCHTCIRVVWNLDVSMEGPTGPLFCPECQIFLPSDLKLEINIGLQTKVHEFAARGSVLVESPTSAGTIMCDHCIAVAAVAVKSCLTCDASLCIAHTQVHQQREALRGHTLIEVTGDLVSYKCREHSEELKLFCQEDQVAVCSLCVVIGAHKSHQVVQLQEACSDFKKKLEVNETLLMERRHAVECALKDLEPMFPEMLNSAEAYRTRVSEKYSRMKALIEEDERLMMSILEAEMLYSTKCLESKRKSLESHIKHIDTLRSTSKSLIHETNNLKFLQQITTDGLEKQLNLPAIPEVNAEYCTPDKMKTVEQMVDDLFQAVSQNFPRIWSYLRAITLDPETAHPKLEISEDRTEVRWSNKQPIQEGRDTERFDSQYSVLSRESFSSGSHYWEVIVWEKPYWLIGVTYGPISRTGEQNLNSSNLGMNRVFCYLYHGNGKYLVCYDSQETTLSIGERIQKLGVCVDIQRGVLSFYDADRLAFLHSFSVQFLEAVYPTFNPCIDFKDQNRQPLILFHLRGKTDGP